MMTTVFFATLLCWELASAYPFPEQLPYYGYEPVGVPEQRGISQPIQISNLARSQNSELAYQQQQLAYLQQENLRRQNYENLLRNEEQRQQAALNQRIANQLLIPTQPERSYNNAIPLSTVREPYINSVPLRPIEPITQQYYQNQRLREPYPTIEAPQQLQVQSPEPVVEPASHVRPTYQYNQQYQPVPHYNVLYDPRIRKALASTPLKKRYLVLHPNGTIEHIDRIEQIVERHPNYILVNAGDISKVKESATPSPVQPLAPVPPLQPVSSAAPATPIVPVTPASPVKPAATVTPLAPAATIPPDSPTAPVEPLGPGVLDKTTTGPVKPVAPLTPVVPPTPVVPADHPVSATPAPSGAIPPILNGTVPGPKPTVSPPTGPKTTTKTVTAQTASPPKPLSTTLAPPPVDATTTSAPTVETTITPPVVNATPVYPLSDPVPVTTEHPTTPSVVNSTATAINPPPSDVPIPSPVTDPTVVSPPDITTENPTTPSVVNSTATARNPPPSDVPIPSPVTDPTVVSPPDVTTENPTTPSVVNSTATAINLPPSDVPIPSTVTDPTVVSPPDVTTENPVIPALENATAIAADSRSTKESDVCTNGTSVAQSDAAANVNATATKSTDLTIPDLPFAKIPTKPIVWFRSTDLNFFDKLTNGNETFDIVYFFNVPREPRVLRDTKTTIHANGTVVEETVETIYDDEDAPPRVIKTTKVTNPDDTKPKT